MVSRQERSFPKKFLEGKVMPLGRTGKKAGPCATSGGTWLSHDVEDDEEVVSWHWEHPEKNIREYEKIGLIGYNCKMSAALTC